MSDLKVTDRRWWARDDRTPATEVDEPKLKPTYVEELEARLTARDAEFHELVAKYRAAAGEFDEARARLRKEVSKDVERSRRSTLVAFLEVLDNLDRALEAAGGRPEDPVVHGVSLVRQQFLSTLEGFGVTRIETLGQSFDPIRHEAVSIVGATDEHPDGRVCGVIRPGYVIGDDVLRPAQVAVARRSA
jgi:molecular chaperone GrpE